MVSQFYQRSMEVLALLGVAKLQRKWFCFHYVRFKLILTHLFARKWYKQLQRLNTRHNFIHLIYWKNRSSCIFQRSSWQQWLLEDGLLMQYGLQRSTLQPPFKTFDSWLNCFIQFFKDSPLWNGDAMKQQHHNMNDVLQELKNKPSLSSTSLHIMKACIIDYN